MDRRPPAEGDQRQPTVPDSGCRFRVLAAYARGQFWPAISAIVVPRSRFRPAGRCAPPTDHVSIMRSERLLQLGCVRGPMTSNVFDAAVTIIFVGYLLSKYVASGLIRRLRAERETLWAEL